MVKIKLLFVFAFMSMSVCTYSQTPKEYTYDNAGNQISRKPAYTILSQQNSPKSTGTDTSQIDQLEKEFRIYPNPTKGDLIVKVYPFDVMDKFKVTVSDLQGRKIMESVFDAEINYLDLMNQPDGIYILNIEVQGVIKSWKIIKE